MSKNIKTSPEKAKKGFTLIEVMLFIGLTGLILIGALAGTYSAIGRQRYNDSVRSYAEFLRRAYSEVAAPESIGSVDDNNPSAGRSEDLAIYGKAIVYGLDQDANSDQRIYSVTLVGNATPPKDAGDFVDELKAVELGFFCGRTEGGTTTFPSTVTSYLPLWDAKIENTSHRQFEGTVIIARSPSTGTIHTAFTSSKYNLRDFCKPDSSSASTYFTNDLKNNTSSFSTTDDIDFCVHSQYSNIIRDIRIAADGHNTSAVNIIDDDSGLRPDQGGSRCRL